MIIQVTDEKKKASPVVDKRSRLPKKDDEIEEEEGEEEVEKDSRTELPAKKLKEKLNQKFIFCFDKRVTHK